jgi:hypothetical protein
MYPGIYGAGGSSATYLVPQTFQPHQHHYQPQQQQQVNMAMSSSALGLHQLSYQQQQQYAVAPDNTGLSETISVSIPNSSVGALIGAGGSFIRQMSRLSGAFMKVRRRRKMLFNVYGVWHLIGLFHKQLS